MDAVTCDCGYEFATGIQRAPRSERTKNLPPSLSRSEREAVAETADRYRGLLLLVLAQSFLGGGSRLVVRLLRGDGEPAIVLVATLGAMVVLTAISAVAARRAYLVATGTGFASPAAWAAAVFLGGIFALLFMNGRARSWAGRYGMRFGLFGPKLADVDRLASGK